MNVFAVGALQRVDVEGWVFMVPSLLLLSLHPDPALVADGLQHTVGSMVVDAVEVDHGVGVQRLACILGEIECAEDRLCQLAVNEVGWH